MYTRVYTPRGVHRTPGVYTGGVGFQLAWGVTPVHPGVVILGEGVWDLRRLDALRSGVPACDTVGDSRSLSRLLWGSGVVRLPAQPTMVRPRRKILPQIC